MGKDMKQIKELASDNVLISAYLLLAECKDLKRSLSLELDLARDRRVAQDAEFQEFMTELWGTLRQIQAQFRIDATLLGLISPYQTGEKAWQDEEKNSNPSHLLNGFAKSGS